MQDNFEMIKDYIALRETDNGIGLKAIEAFDRNEDKCYVVELIRRGKDHKELPCANVHFKNYYINKISDLDKYKEEIIALCDMLKMRAYFSVNYKSYRQVLLDTVAEGARRVAADDFKKPYAIYDSCSGKYCANGNKTWIVDIDQEDAYKSKMTLMQLTSFYKDIIENRCAPYKKTITMIPTKTGYHLITHPFEIRTFNKCLLDKGLRPYSENSHQIIKKNHLTLLYCY